MVGFFLIFLEVCRELFQRATILEKCDRKNRKVDVEKLRGQKSEPDIKKSLTSILKHHHDLQNRNL